MLKERRKNQPGFHDAQTVKLVLELGASFAGEEKLEPLLEKIVDHCQLLTNADGCTLYLKANEDFLSFSIVKNRSLNVSVSGMDVITASYPNVPMNPSFISAYAAINNKTVNIPDVYKSDEFDFTGPKKFDDLNGYRCVSMLVSPLTSLEREVVGVIQLVNAMDEETGEVISFENNHEFLVNSLGNYAAIAINNVWLAEKARKSTVLLKEANFDAIFSLAVAAEAKDDDTGDHVRRIQYYSSALARKIGMSDEEVEIISISSIMHDVGKISVPDSILRKPGKLTDEEFDIMKNHTHHGMKILPAKPFFKTARDIARNHHEKWDGSGYPDGLAGEGIPLAARVVAVADVFDALTSRRPYKEPWPFQKATDELIKCKGKHFDPSLVDAWVSLTEEGVIREIYDQWKK